MLVTTRVICRANSMANTLPADDRPARDRREFYDLSKLIVSSV